MIDSQALATQNQTRSMVCMKDVDVINTGEGALKNHASGKHHKSLWMFSTQNLVMFSINHLMLVMCLGVMLY
jgi:hypothetical protein